MMHPASEESTPRAAVSSSGANPEAIALAKSVSIAHKPFYYGFNCRPRQVRSYGPERAVESVKRRDCPEAEAILAARILAKWEKAAARWKAALTERNARAFHLSARTRRSWDTSLGRTSDRLLHLERALEALGRPVRPHWMREEVQG